MLLPFIMLLLCIITLQHAPSEFTRAPGPLMMRVYTWAAMGAGVSPGKHPMQRVQVSSVGSEPHDTVGTKKRKSIPVPTLNASLLSIEY